LLEKGSLVRWHPHHELLHLDSRSPVLLELARRGVHVWVEILISDDFQRSGGSRKSGGKGDLNGPGVLGGCSDGLEGESSIMVSHLAVSVQVL
jgi:hypothetical protein